MCYFCLRPNDKSHSVNLAEVFSFNKLRYEWAYHEIYINSLHKYNSVKREAASVNPGLLKPSLVAAES